MLVPSLVTPPRLTNRAFPAYRHRIGQTPHPVTDPLGHSFGIRETPITAPPPPDRWRECEAYLFGCDLFNHGYWWEAHEAWESLWRALPRESVQGRFIQALIQVAAACLKAEAGEPGGWSRTLERASANIQPVLDEVRRSGAKRYMGIDAEAWWQAARARAGSSLALASLRIRPE